MIRKTIKENKDKPFFCFLLFFLILLLGLPISASFSYFLAFYHKTYPKIALCQIQLGGKNKNEIDKIISLKLKENLPEKITINFKEEHYDLSSDLVTFQEEKTGQKVLNLGRERPFVLNVKRIFELLRQGDDTSYEYKIDNEKLDSQIASISAKVLVPAVNPDVKVSKTSFGKKISIEKGKNGLDLDTRTLKIKLNEALACPQKEIALDLPTVLIAPKISDTEAESLKNRAESLLNKEIKIKLEDQNWTINDEEIINFISFQTGFDQIKLKNYVKDLAKTINSEPENALFSFENNLVSVFRPSSEGISLKEDELTEKLLTALNTLETTQTNQEIEIPVIKIPAEISTGDANSLGIKELLGKGSSLFYGSMTERVHNLDLARMRVSNVLIPPGETFSFNSTLGDVSADTGFKQAYIIKEGRTILGDGGGVCQVSTTLFRAVLNSGLPIVERHAHAYRVHYYEDDLGPGFDATVFDPTADLKFTNNTSAHILIQSEINIKKKSMAFEIYGSSDGRKVEISKVRVWDKAPPPPDLYQDDPTLPIGTIKQIDWKAWGAKAAFDYKVTRNDEVLTEKTFTSLYKPWQAIYLRGTGR